MDFFTAFTTVEEVCLDIVTDGEQRTAGRVCRCILAVRTSHTLSNRSCKIVASVTFIEPILLHELLTLCNTKRQDDRECSDEVFEGHDM